MNNILTLVTLVVLSTELQYNIRTKPMLKTLRITLPKDKNNILNMIIPIKYAKLLHDDE